MAERSPTTAGGIPSLPEFWLDACPGNLYLWLAVNDAGPIEVIRRELQTQLNVTVSRGTARKNLRLPERIPARFRWYVRFPQPTLSLEDAIARLLGGQPQPSPAPPPARTPAPSYRLSSADEELLRRLRGMLTRGEVTSGFADSVLRQWEESGRVTAKQLAGVRRLVARAEERAAEPRVASGKSRKPGSHRSNW